MEGARWDSSTKCIAESLPKQVRYSTVQYSMAGRDMAPTCSTQTDTNAQFLSHSLSHSLSLFHPPFSPLYFSSSLPAASLFHSLVVYGNTRYSPST